LQNYFKYFEELSQSCIFTRSMKKLALIILTFTLVFGCKPKFDPSDYFKQVDIVYAVLDPNAPKQYVQVSRGFQTNGGNAEEIAQNKDSIYHQDSVIVELIEQLGNGNEVTRITLKKQLFDDREEGDFANPEHYLYVLDSTDYKVKENTNYKVQVTNTVSKKVSYAEIKTIKTFFFKENGTGGIDINHIRLEEIIDDEFDIYNDNGEEVYYDASLFIPVITVDEDNNTLATDTLEIVISSKSRAKSGEITTFSVSGNNFFNTVYENIEPLPDGTKNKRIIGGSKLVSSCYSKEIYEYILAEESFNALSQSKPFYSNVYDVDTKELQAGVVASTIKIEEVANINSRILDYLIQEKPNLRFSY